LLILAVIIPDKGLKLGDSLSLHFFKPQDLLEEDTTEYADISGIITNSSAIDEVPAPDNAALKDKITEVAAEVEPDTLIPEAPLMTDSDSLRQITHLIEFPPGRPNIFDEFFNQVTRIGNTHRLIRVLHYGDSQIEADRMTSFIRYRLQQKFGGSGCGLVPVVPLYNGKMSIKQSVVGDWDRYTGFINQDKTLGHKRFGALFSFSKFRVRDSLRGSEALLSFSPSPMAYRSSRQFNHFSLYLGGKAAGTEMKVYADDSLLDSVLLTAGTPYHRYTWNTSGTPASFRLEFTGRMSPEIYGITLDNNWGVAVDNIPLRGSSGLVFSKVDTVFLKKMYNDMNVGMILLQFGGNVIPYLTKDYDYYERLFRRELGVIRRMLPDVPVIVIGPSDMSEKVDGKFTTFSNLEPVRDALRRAALGSGCAFWDMYAAMGGRNSMPSWVAADPPLAVSDYVHFNTKGARIIAEMFYNAFIYDYNLLLQNKAERYADNR
jgi:lysophospholipase L1-like esterase